MVKLFCYPVLKLMEVKLSPLHPSTIHQGGLDKRLYFTRIKNDTNMDSADSRPLVGQIEMRCNKPETSNPQSLVFLFLEGLKSSDHDKFLWGQCHARQQWLPRTWHRSGCRTLDMAKDLRFSDEIDSKTKHGDGACNAKQEYVLRPRQEETKCWQRSIVWNCKYVRCFYLTFNASQNAGGSGEERRC